MSDYSEILKKLAEAKLAEQRPEVIEVNKPVFQKSQPNSNVRLRLKSSGKMDETPVDYAKLNNPDPKPEQPQHFEKLKSIIDRPKVVGIPVVSEPVDMPIGSVPPPQDLREKSLSDKAIERMVASLQEIPDEESDSKEATLQEMLDEGDLTEYEKDRLLEWANRDALRMNLIKQAKN